MTLTILPFPLDPDYGQGAYRRRIRLRRPAENVVLATLDDSYHAMQCLLRHDRLLITSIESTLSRVPTNVCMGAANPLQELIGMPLDIAAAELYGDGRPRRNCTHLFDIAALAMRHALRAETERCYDVIIPDQRDTPITAEVWRNDRCVHAWQVSEGVIVAPVALAHAPLISGFNAWAPRTFEGDDLEAAQILHMGYYIAQSRRYQIGTFAGQPLSSNPTLKGVCHSYAPEQIERAILTGDNVRDFSSAVIEAVTVDT